MNVIGTTAVVTGASRGLGAGLAREFHRLGLNLGLCSRQPPVLTGADRVVAAQVDVTDGAAVASFARQVAERFGHIDLWINNAGVLDPIGPLRELDPAEVERHLAINVMGVFHGSQAYVRHIRATGVPGVLINISSGAARTPYAGWSIYCAGKAAVDRMTECIAVEEAGTGLRVHSVAPGVIDTDMQERIRGQSEEAFPLVERFRQMKRDNAFTTADAVAGRLLALAFDPEKRTDDVSIDLRG